jgi:hypothetical protein
VAIDTNHLERALRVIPMGRRNWLFAWTELGAKQLDVLQRVGQHPATLVQQLTPRLWKELYASIPLRSELRRMRERQSSQ